MKTPPGQKTNLFSNATPSGSFSCCGAFCYINTSLSGLKSRRDDIIIELDFQDCIPNPEGVTLFIYPNPKRNHIARPGQISTRRLAQIFSVQARFAPAPQQC